MTAFGGVTLSVSRFQRSETARGQATSEWNFQEAHDDDGDDDDADDDDDGDDDDVELYVLRCQLTY